MEQKNSFFPDNGGLERCIPFRSDWPAWFFLRQQPGAVPDATLKEEEQVHDIYYVPASAH